MTVAATAAVSNPLSTYITKQKAAQEATDAAAAIASGATSSTGVSAIAGNFNTFIKLLTTQLQHQDPTAAADSNQFTQELVQFAQVEQQLNTNSNLNKIYNVQSASSLATGVGYVGNYVESSTATNQFAVQSGSSEFGYTLASTAQNVKIDITDSSNNAVASFTGNGRAGANYVSWNGKNTSTGKQSPDGTYTFAVTATDGNGKTITVSSPKILSKVTAVSSNDDGSLTLGAGDLAVKSTTINAVYTATTKPAATALVAPTLATAGS